MTFESIPATARPVAGRVMLRSSRSPALAIVLGLLTLPSHAQTYAVLHDFRGRTDGANPEAGLVMDAKGNLYSTTVSGGTGCSSSGGCGTVFKLAGRKETVLYKFNGSPDGANPSGGLILDAAGNLYGVTNVGGAYDGGSVFKVDPGEAETVLYSFGPNEVAGGEPSGSLVVDANGNFFGTAISGGTGNSGIAFKVAPDGTETVLHSFCTRGGSGCTDGEEPSGGLVMDAAGNLYGTTEIDFGQGTGSGAVFKVTQGGEETTLHIFSYSKGAYPTGGLIMDAADNLYGTTLFGGTGTCQSSGHHYSGCGTVFKVDASGKETVLYNFCSTSDCTDGSMPSAGLFMDAEGNLYGTTLSGGTGVCTGQLFSGCGTVFELSASGTETVLHTFTGVVPDGAFPYSRLIMDANGNLYGTASAGGKFGNGIVFEITPY